MVDKPAPPLKKPRKIKPDLRISAGVVGLGTMGRPIALKLASCGTLVTAWNRTPDKAHDLDDDRIRIAASPGETAALSQVVVTSVKDDGALRDVTFGPAGILDALPASSVHCDTSTISPALAREMAEAYATAGKQFVHAPVLGSRKQVADGSLLIFACGPHAAITAAEPVITFLGSRIWRLPEPGSAAVLKLACNMMIAGMITTLSQSMVFGAKQGVPPELLLEVLGASALSAPMFQSKGHQILRGDWSANFFVDNLIKDVWLALEAGQEAGVPLPVLAVVQQLLLAASDAGFGLEDYSAVSKVIASQAGL